MSIIHTEESKNKFLTVEYPDRIFHFSSERLYIFFQWFFQTLATSRRKWLPQFFYFPDAFLITSTLTYLYIKIIENFFFSPFETYHLCTSASARIIRAFSSVARENSLFTKLDQGPQTSCCEKSARLQPTMQGYRHYCPIYGFSPLLGAGKKEEKIIKSIDRIRLTFFQDLKEKRFVEPRARCRPCLTEFFRQPEILD